MNGPGFLVSEPTRHKLEELVRTIPGATGGGGQTAPPIGRAFSGARVYNSTTQSVGTSPANLTFDSETFDTNDYHSTSSNTHLFTAASAGYYLVGGWAKFDNLTAGTYCNVQIFRAGSSDTTAIAYAATSGQAVTVNFSALCNVSAGATFYLTAFHSDFSGNKNVTAEFWIHRAS